MPSKISRFFLSVRNSLPLGKQIVKWDYQHRTVVNRSIFSQLYQRIVGLTKRDSSYFNNMVKESARRAILTQFSHALNKDRATNAPDNYLSEVKKVANALYGTAALSLDQDDVVINANFVNDTYANTYQSFKNWPEQFEINTSPKPDLLPSDSSASGAKGIDAAFASPDLAVSMSSLVEPEVSNPASSEVDQAAEEKVAEPSKPKKQGRKKIGVKTGFRNPLPTELFKKRKKGTKTKALQSGDTVPTPKQKDTPVARPKSLPSLGTEELLPIADAPTKGKKVKRSSSNPAQRLLKATAKRLKLLDQGAIIPEDSSPALSDVDPAAKEKTRSKAEAKPEIETGVNELPPLTDAPTKGKKVKRSSSNPLKRLSKGAGNLLHLRDKGGSTPKDSSSVSVDTASIPKQKKGILKAIKKAVGTKTPK